MFVAIFPTMLITIDFVLSCQSGRGGNGDDVPVFNKNRILENWTLTPEMQAKWQDWYRNWYLQQENYTEIEKNTKESDYYDPDRPDAWKDFKPGRKPQDPPPWAVIPEDSGKPYVCFMRPIKGDCNKTLTRWGYNPYIRQCTTIIWSGCGGNENNFYSKRRCEQTCVYTGAGVSPCLLFGRRVNC